ncbi:hypothetical protein I6A84_42500 [Frankia sp. CNm7]|uniref:Uncharacterized protein n=1 Tax=Frankia nepalensis TaxID=1836974 RepID=A0A937REW8_9ACTN|nr:hypothetical protein [Frankia nepalensis]MBL7509646.1 hypothetical protein [Frankia nepalensis]MBL7524536.1 hypothetical protein [Frankia nepalensis]MBL7630858.1 hypothetical protein [Frankia nepalensis]
MTASTRPRPVANGRGPLHGVPMAPLFRQKWISPRFAEGTTTSKLREFPNWLSIITGLPATPSANHTVVRQTAAELWSRQMWTRRDPTRTTASRLPTPPPRLPWMRLTASTRPSSGRI